MIKMIDKTKCEFSRYKGILSRKFQIQVKFFKTKLTFATVWLALVMYYSVIPLILSFRLVLFVVFSYSTLFASKGEGVSLMSRYIQYTTRKL